MLLSCLALLALASITRLRVPGLKLFFVITTLLWVVVRSLWLVVRSLWVRLAPQQPDARSAVHEGGDAGAVRGCAGERAGAPVENVLARDPEAAARASTESALRPARSLRAPRVISGQLHRHEDP
jgi:hypothetical protein